MTYQPKYARGALAVATGGDSCVSFHELRAGTRTLCIGRFYSDDLFRRIKFPRGVIAIHEWDRCFRCLWMASITDEVGRPSEQPVQPGTMLRPIVTPHGTGRVCMGSAATYIHGGEDPIEVLWNSDWHPGFARVGFSAESPPVPIERAPDLVFFGSLEKAEYHKINWSLEFR